jgi:tetratricopeptide (TPR) repeat protein
MKFQNTLFSVRLWTWLVFLTAIALYIPTIKYGFVFDDHIAIVKNAHIRSLNNLPTIFTSTLWAGSNWETYLYRPFTVATYCVNYAFTGLAPWGYHAVNIFLHALASWLVFRLALIWNFSIPVSGLSALLFATHPIHVEVVVSVVGRQDLLMTCLVMATLLLHAKAIQHRLFLFFSPPLVYAAAILSKETGAMALLLLLIQDILMFGWKSWRDMQQKHRQMLYAIYIFVFIVCFLVRWAVVGRLGIPEVHYIDNPIVQASIGERMLTAIGVIGKGLALLMLPVNLSPDYSFQSIPIITSIIDPRFIFSAGILASFITLGLIWRHKLPLLWFSTCWYLIALFPGANLLVPIGTIFGERLLYLPSVAFCLLLGWLLTHIYQRWHEVIAVLATTMIVLILIARTMTYAAVWNDEVRLFSTAAKVVPKSTKVHLKLGEALAAHGRFPEAVAAYQCALEIDDNNYKARLGLATAYEELGRHIEAEQNFQLVLNGHPRNPDVFYGLGIVQRGKGHFKEAADYWQQALAIDPRHAPSLSDLGTFYFMEGQADKAENFWSNAVAVDPMMANAWYNLGFLYHNQGDSTRAKKAWQQFLATAGEIYEKEREQIYKILYQ